MDGKIWGLCTRCSRSFLNVDAFLEHPCQKEKNMDWGDIPKDWYCFVWPGKKSATIAEPCEIVEVPHRFKSQAETRLVIDGKRWGQEQYRVRNEPSPHVVLYEPQRWDFDFRIDYKLEEELKLVEWAAYEVDGKMEVEIITPSPDIWNPIIRFDGDYTQKEKDQIKAEIEKLIKDDQHILVLPEDVVVEGAFNDPSIIAHRPYRAKHVLAVERELQEMGKSVKVYAMNPDGTRRFLGVCSDFKVGPPHPTFFDLSPMPMEPADKCAAAVPKQIPTPPEIQKMIDAPVWQVFIPGRPIKRRKDDE